MKELTTITIMRKWHNPQILITVNNELIELKMTMTDFQTAITEAVYSRVQNDLPEAIGSVTWTFRDDTFRKQIGEAIRTVLPVAISGAVTEAVDAIKAESKKVMGGR